MTSKPNGKLLMALTVIVVFNFTQCKYEDGPKISLRTKTSRLTGEWEVVKVDNERITGNTFTMEFEKGGDFTWSYNYGGVSYSYHGEWEWEDGKETIDLTVDGENMEFDVKRLTNDELWFEDNENSEYELEKD